MGVQSLKTWLRQPSTGRRRVGITVTCLVASAAAGAVSGPRNLALALPDVALGNGTSGPSPGPESVSTPRFLPEWVVLFIAGAFGECGGQLFLYPVETIKVLCQKTDQNVLATLAGLVRQPDRARMLRGLFNGVGATMLVSIFLGAAYFMTFKASTAHFTKMFAEHMSDTAHVQHLLDEERRAPRDEDRAPRPTDPRAAVLSAVSTSVILALLTGPVEMARNRVQAGIVKKDLFRYTLSRRGLRDTLPLMLPYMLVAVPHDFAELVTFYVGSTLLDGREGRLPVQRMFLDALVGGAAGTAGVLLSAPADCIKTKMLTLSKESGFAKSGAIAKGMGTRQLWLAAARYTYKSHGLPGFFIGILPRLVDEVPGSMLHWTLVEACLRALKPYMVVRSDGTSQGA